MTRDVPYSIEYVCDVCGETGAYDFMGDYICDSCYWNSLKENEDDLDL